MCTVQKMEIYNANGDLVFEGMHNTEAPDNWPFTDENFHVTTSSECWRCTKRNVVLKDDGITIKVETICASETRSVEYQTIGRMSTGRECCTNVMKVPGLGTFKGDYCTIDNPCCMSSSKVEQLRNAINERVEWHEKNKKSVVAAPAAAPQMMMAAPPVMAAPMMAAPMMAAPQMVAAPQMMAVRQ